MRRVVGVQLLQRGGDCLVGDWGLGNWGLGNWGRVYRATKTGLKVTEASVTGRRRAGAYRNATIEVAFVVR